MTEITRCAWSTSDPIYIAYHDEEWGVPVHDDRHHFEMITLEGAQAGLSWLTVLRKRENYRAAFDNFDPVTVAEYSEQDVERLVNNAGIVRNRAKILSTIGNATAFLGIQAEFGSFDNYIWNFVDHKPVINSPKSLAEIHAKTELSDKISKGLVKRGFKFVGSTIIYAYMQACGLVNDHLVTCFKSAQ